MDVAKSVIGYTPRRPTTRMLDGLTDAHADDGVVLRRVGADDKVGKGVIGDISIEFVMAPEPNAVTRPVTVELCQSRAQWSTLFVPNNPLAIFWTR